MPKPRKNEKESDFISRCMGDAEAKSDFPNKDQRLAFCYSTWRDRNKKKAGNMKLAVAVTQLRSTNMRKETLQGREHLVVPATLVQGQVLHNNMGATFLPPAEITNEWAQEWNAAPVVIDHPTKRGVYVSARDPEVWNTRGVGYVFAAHAVRNGTAQLKADVWLDLERANKMEELRVIVERLQKGQNVELSTGFVSVTEEVSGNFNGEAYERILHPKGADHLAIFVDKIGACSLEDGCGLGVQHQQDWEVYYEVPGRKEDGDVDGPDSAANTCERGRLIRLMERIASWAGPEDAPETESAAQEEETGTTFRTLLRQLKALSVSNAEIAEVVGRSEKCIGLIERGQEKNPSQESLQLLQEFAESFGGNQDDRSDEERRRALGDALDMRYGGKGKFVWVEAVFSEAKEVVFGVAEDKVDGVKEQLYRTVYAMSEQEIEFEDPTEVQRRVKYEPTGNEREEETQMPDDKKAAEGTEQEPTQVAANADAGSDGEAQQEPVKEEGAAVNTQEPVETPAEAPKVETVDQSEVISNLQKRLDAQDEEIAALRKITEPVVQEKEQERQTLIEELVGCQEVFGKAELEAKPIEELRKLRTMTRTANYSGRGGPRVVENEGEEPRFVEPVPYWQKKEGTE